MEPRQYYSRRTGRKSDLAFPTLAALFLKVYERFLADSYFDQALGKSCPDRNDEIGSFGADPEAFVALRLRKTNLWPIGKHLDEYSEEDLFDVIELLHDAVSLPLPLDGWYHSYADCGWHYKQFDVPAGQRTFRTEVNDLLRDYRQGFELSEQGEILELAPLGLDKLLDQPTPSFGNSDSQQKMVAAVRKFRRFGASDEERREAVRSLFDLFEYLRPMLKDVISSADEADLFNIANNFAIRHHNTKQKTQYDTGIWLTWMFYTVLATLHVALRLLSRKAPPGPSDTVQVRAPS